MVLLNNIIIQIACFKPESSTCPLGFFPTTLIDVGLTLPTVINSTLLCRQCHSLCASCDGKDITDCQTCSAAFSINPNTNALQCLKSCDGRADKCVTCHDQCAGCTGRTNRECVSCKEGSVELQDGKNIMPLCGGNAFF